MGTPFPNLTLFLGPQTQAGLALNLAIRNNRPGLIKAGLLAQPTRIASPALRGLLDRKRPLAERNAGFAAFMDQVPAFYAALNIFPMTHKGLPRFQLFPDAPAQLDALSEVVGYSRLRVIVTPDQLPDFFLAAGSEVLERAVRETSWDVLYELSWVDIVADLRASLPKAEILVLTPRGMALGQGPLVDRLLGPGAGVVGPFHFLREALDVTGQAVLDRMDPDSQLTDEVAADLYASFALRADEAMCDERLGIDRVTRALLAQRFDEDMAEIIEIAGADQVEVI